MIKIYLYFFLLMWKQRAGEMLPQCQSLRTLPHLLILGYCISFIDGKRLTLYHPKDERQQIYTLHPLHYAQLAKSLNIMSSHKSVRLKACAIVTNPKEPMISNVYQIMKKVHVFSSKDKLEYKLRAVCHLQI